MADSDNAAPKPPTYSAQELADEGYLSPHPPYVVIGALAGERRENFTVEQAQAVVEKWLKKPIEVEQAQPDEPVEEE
jgi:hypothetical protein